MRVFVVGVTIACAMVANAQEAGPREQIGRSDAAILAEGWAGLAAGDVERAAERVANLESRGVGGLPALVLGVEVDLARQDVAGALGRYRRWIESRTYVEPSILRRISLTVIWQASISSRDPSAQAAALIALADAGDTAAADTVSRAVAAGSRPELQAMTRRGDEAAVARASTEVRGPAANKLPLIEALGESGRASAVPVLLALLADPRPEHAAAAATGLGRLRVQAAAPRLRALLADTAGPPALRLAAAGALLRLGDRSGEDILLNSLQSSVPGIRLSGAAGLAPGADASWVASVLPLTADADPTIALEAAALLAPREPEAAQAVFSRLASDTDPAVREVVARAMITSVAGDLRSLPTWLDSPIPTLRVAAAVKILQLAR